MAARWPATGLTPQRQGTCKVSRDPQVADQVADIVGLYLDPPGGAVVLSVDEKTPMQALDRIQPLLPISVGAAEKRTHDDVRHWTTNLCAALHVTSGDVYGECHPTRAGASFRAFLKHAVAPHAGKDVHVVLDNLSTPTTPDVAAWREANPQVHCHVTPVGASWINQIEAWFSTLTRQSLRRGTFTSVQVLVTQIRDYLTRWNSNPKRFVWTATADEILVKVRLVQANVRKLVDNNEDYAEPAIKIANGPLTCADAGRGMPAGGFCITLNA